MPLIGSITAPKGSGPVLDKRRYRPSGFRPKKHMSGYPTYRAQLLATRKSSRESMMSGEANLMLDRTRCFCISFARLVFALVALVPFSSPIAYSREGCADWRDPSKHRVDFVTVEDGVRLEVLDWGGSGRTVVLLAGSGNTAHIF